MQSYRGLKRLSALKIVWEFSDQNLFYLLQLFRYVKYFAYRNYFS